jgi:hypothetical protein
MHQDFGVYPQQGRPRICNPHNRAEVRAILDRNDRIQEGRAVPGAQSDLTRHFFDPATKTED